MLFRPIIRKSLLTAIGTLIASSAMAALPPTVQRGKEMAAIAENPQIQSSFKGHPIEAIVFVQSDLYRVKANGCTLEVRIETVPGQTAPGPRQFRVVLGMLEGPGKT